MSYDTTFEQLLTATRAGILRDGADGRLWTDERLTELLNEAYIEFAEATYILRDASEGFRVTLIDGVDQYTYPPQVLAVMSARPAWKAGNLRRTSDPSLRGNSSPAPDTIDWLQQLNAQVLTPGETLAFSTDDSLRTFTVFPVPSATEDGKEIILRVIRLPLKLFDLNELDQKCEIPRQYVMGLPYGACALAYTDQDADGNDPVRAARARAVFDQYIKRAQRGARAQMFQPAQFDFGGSGFSYTR